VLGICAVSLPVWLFCIELAYLIYDETLDR
jgi:hypothetical protein